MKLYFFPGACSHAVHLALREANADFTLVRVDPKTKTTATGESFLTVNPKGYVPALVLNDGQVLTEAAAILQYVADQYPSANLAPAYATLDRYRLMEWLNFISAELHTNMGGLFRADESTRPKLVERLELRLTNAEQLLGDRPFVLGDTLSVADLYLYVILNWSKWTKVDLSRWPKLNALKTRVSERPSAAAARAAENA